MLIKWITCKVTEKQKQLFSDAQAKWKPLEEIEGFLGQVGGCGISISLAPTTNAQSHTVALEDVWRVVKRGGTK